MKALSGAPALIVAATHVMARIQRLAPFATPDMRLRLRGELAQTEMVLDYMEKFVMDSARTTLAAMRPPRALPKARAL